MRSDIQIDHFTKYISSYQRGNQIKRTNNNLQNTSQKTKDRATRTSLKPGVNAGSPEGCAVPALLVGLSCYQEASKFLIGETNYCKTIHLFIFYGCCVEYI